MILPRGSNIDGLISKKKDVSKEWVKTAFPLTAPTNWREQVVCNDDCDNCPLHNNGCAKDCNRWHNLICQDCPCLGSRYADIYWEPETVDPKTNIDAPILPCLLRIREQRKDLEDGEEVWNS